MKTFITSSAIAIAVVTGLVFAADDSVDVKLTVLGCDNDLVCEPGEDNTSCPVDCPLGGGGGGGGGHSVYWVRESIGIHNAPITFYDVFVYAGTSSAIVSWRTNVPTISQVYWGVGGESAKGVVSEHTYALNHSMLVTGLQPSTRYTVTVSMLAPDGATSGFGEEFTTTNEKMGILEHNVTNLTYYREEQGAVHLDWINPANLGDRYVRVVRGSNFYPRDHNEGYLVYEGRRQSVIDTNADPDEDYYYSVFVIGGEGEHSGGVVIKVPKGQSFNDDVLIRGNGESLSSKDFESNRTILAPAKLEAVFMQGGEIVGRAGESFKVNSFLPIISLAKRSVLREGDRLILEVISKDNPKEINRLLYALDDNDNLIVIVPISLIDGDARYSITRAGRNGEVSIGGEFYLKERDGYRAGYLEVVDEVVPDFILLWIFIALIFLCALYLERRK